MTRAELLKLKYDLIMNVYQDSTLARKSKHWGWKRLQDTLAIKKPPLTKMKKVVKGEISLRKEYADSTIKTKKLMAKKVQNMFGKGFNPKGIKKYRKKSYDKIAKNLGFMTLNNQLVEVYMPENRDERHAVWKYWSDRNNKYMPKELYEYAKNVNNRANEQMQIEQKLKYSDKSQIPKYIGEERFVDELSKYGFYALFFQYLEEKDEEDALKIIRPSEDSDWKYVYNVRVWS